MTIQVDSREKARAIRLIEAEFDQQGVKHFISKLPTGDYMSLDNPRLIIDRKQNLSEVCQNVTNDHERFRREAIRAQEMGIQLVILVEHGHGITSAEDVIFWQNPRRHKRVRQNGRWETVETNATTGETLYHIMQTMTRKYGLIWEFCDKRETGKRIIEILGGES